MPTDTPRAWVGCLASYNAGRLIGEWVDATDADELEEAKQRVAAVAVKAAKAAGEYPVYFGDPEEFYIGDYDGFGDGGSMLGEYASFEEVARIGALIEEHGAAFLAFLTHVDSAEEATGERFEEEHRGEWDSEEAFAMEQVNELGWSNVPAQLYTDKYSDDTINVFDELSSYLDWESIAREMFQHGACTYVNGYVFEDV